MSLGDEYWNIRDAIVQTELFVLRMVAFQVRDDIHTIKCFFFSGRTTKKGEEVKKTSTPNKKKPLA